MIHYPRICGVSAKSLDVLDAFAGCAVISTVFRGGPSMFHIADDRQSRDTKIVLHAFLESNNESMHDHDIKYILKSCEKN